MFYLYRFQCDFFKLNGFHCFAFSAALCHLFKYQSPLPYVASSSKGSHMTSSSSAFFDVQKTKVGLVKEVQGGGEGLIVLQNRQSQILAI